MTLDVNIAHAALDQTTCRACFSFGGGGVRDGRTWGQSPGGGGRRGGRPLGGGGQSWGAVAGGGGQCEDTAEGGRKVEG